MNATHDTDQLPWWEQELPNIRQKQSAYLKRHLPALRVDHEDLINATLLSLTEHVRGHSSTLPASWFQANSSRVSEADRSHLHKLATVILKRRIADNFRARSPFPNLTRLDDFSQEVAAIPDTNVRFPERKILLASVLEVTLSVLNQVKAEDRDLIALVAEDPTFRKRLDPNERQRLHRVRKKLKDEIARRFGADVAELLRYWH